MAKMGRMVYIYEMEIKGGEVVAGREGGFAPCASDICLWQVIFTLSVSDIRTECE